jgi:hypothetical protein
VIPLWLKIAYTLFVCGFVPINRRQYGYANFLWFSDLAVFLVLGSLWAESALFASMAGLAILLPETAWNLDYFFRLLIGREGIGLCNYMFDPAISRPIRALSLFHVWLPPLILWLLFRLGYDPRALGAQCLLSLATLILCYFLSPREMNINWVFGFGERPQSRLPAPLFALLIAIAFPVLIYLPTHVLLTGYFRHAG